MPRNEEGLPDFKYVATHICDSIKRRLESGRQWHGAPRRIRDWTPELLDGGRLLDHDLDQRRSEGLPDDDEQRGLAILQRMIELSLYAEEKLKSG